MLEQQESVVPGPLWETLLILHCAHITENGGAPSPRRLGG